MTNSKTTTIAWLLAGGALLASSPAFAQVRSPETSSQRRAAQQAREAQQNRQNQPNQAGQPQRRFQLSRPEQTALVPLEQAVTAAQQAGQGANWAAAQALLAPARAAARGNDARYLVAKFEYAIAVGTNNTDAQEAALTALAANAATPAAELTDVRRILARFPHLRAERAFNAGDFATAERIYRQILQANPGDTLAQGNLRVALSRGGNTAGAMQLVQDEIRAAEANGGRASEALYRRAVDASRRAGQRAGAATTLQQLVTAYPTPANWRLAVDFLRETPAEDVQLLVDVYRLARTANVIQAGEYPALANTLIQASFFGEAKAVIDAGIAARTITGSEAEVRAAVNQITPRLAQDQAGLAAEIREARGSGTARQARNVGDALYGYGRYAEAAELYRAALTKGGEDANLLNTRIGASLALAGQRPAAETAFRAVTGPRAEIAGFWLAWLNRRQG